MTGAQRPMAAGRARNGAEFGKMAAILTFVEIKNVSLETACVNHRNKRRINCAN
jgi:hypothetical protein